MHFADTAPLAVEEQPTLEAGLGALKEHIASYRAALTEEGIWLFLATLGCWSVSQPLLQLIGFGVAAVMFGERMASRIAEKRSFSTLARAVELRIATAPDLAEERSMRLTELMELRKRELSALTAFRHGRIFLLSWAFFGVSFVYSIAHLAVKSAG
jgi:hypothetical protein